jgi:hypothetical protein
VDEGEFALTDTTREVPFRFAGFIQGARRAGSAAWLTFR